MTPTEQRERNFKLSKVIIDHFGQNFFKGKKVLDLGSGNGEFANIFAKLGCDVTCVDARVSNIHIINKNFPHLKTLQINLEERFPFEDFSFDLVLSIDLLCHLKNYKKHIQQILSVAESIVLETEVLDSPDPDLVVSVFESKEIESHSYLGEGSIVSDKNIQNTIANLSARFKRIDETKLNDTHFRYDWVQNNLGRKAGTRRFWIIRRDKLLVKKMNTVREVKEAQTKIEYSELFLNTNNKSTNSKAVISNVPYISESSTKATEFLNKFVIVIPSFNNAKWCEKNILSALNQNYAKFRIIFTDDCSTDDTFNIVDSIVKSSIFRNKCSIIKNTTRKGAIENLYNMIHSCDDDEIIITLDGDDWLPDNEILNRLKNHYADNNTWITYGQYKNSNDNSVGISASYSKNIVTNTSFRGSSWKASHLRTFYSWLFKKIKRSDLMYENKFLAMSWDLAMMFGMLEMAGDRSKFISDIMYVYNVDNPIGDSKVNVEFQQKLDRHLRKMPKYKKLSEMPKIQHKESSIILFKELGKFGRLGNQCFQVAAIISFAYRNNVSINGNWYCNYTHKNMTDYFKNKIMTSSMDQPKIEFDYKEPNYYFTDIPYHKNMSLHGYFQSEKYFEDCKDIIRHYFEPADEVVSKIRVKYGKYLDSNSCSVHIRRGDFVGNHTHSVCDTDYYIRAIEKIKSLEKIDNFLILSDDITWCRKNLSNNYIFIDGNLDIEDLFLQSLCKHNIISNSSFSWWGAWLNKNQNKIVISPSRWFNDKSNNDDKDIFTKEMIKI